MIKIQSYPINNMILSKKLLSIYVNQFWKEVFSKISTNKHLWLMCKVNYSIPTPEYKTLGHLRRVNYSDKELFVEYLTARLSIFNESYSPSTISNITFSYIINQGLATDQDRTLLQDLSSKSPTIHRFNNLSLPISMNPADYGKILVNNLVQIGSETINRFIVESGIRSYIIDVSADGLRNNVRIQGATDLKWVDTVLNEGFKREIGKSTIYFIDGEIVLRKQQLNAKPISKLTKDKTSKIDFLTMDIETVTKDFQLIPYLICAYNGSRSISAYAELKNGEINQKALFN